MIKVGRPRSGQRSFDKIYRIIVNQEHLDLHTQNWGTYLGL